MNGNFKLISACPINVNLKSDFYLRCIEQIKNSPYIELSHDLEIQKAIVYLKAKNFTMVIKFVQLEDAFL